MFEHDGNENSFEETVRQVARELGHSVERAMERVDLDEIADKVGVDPTNAREWADSIGGWLRAQAENLGEEVAQRGGAQQPPSDPEPRTTSGDTDPLSGAGPHPLDLPSDEQGLALTALDSGRWMVEPGTNRLSARGDGAGPNDALGLVRELRTRDWISVEGKLTLAGHHALRRWLAAARS